jgi:hypothetical protein
VRRRGRSRRARSSQLIGFLRSASLTDATHLVAGFRRGLNEAGFVEGRNVAVEYRSADGHNDRLSALIADLIGRVLYWKRFILHGNVMTRARFRSCPMALCGTGHSPPAWVGVSNDHWQRNFGMETQFPELSTEIAG